MSYIQKRAYAGMVARGGESLVTSISYVNQSEKELEYGTFVALAPEGGCKDIEDPTETILGVTLAIGYQKKLKPLELVSVMSLPVGAEVWVQKEEDAELEIGKKVNINVGGKISDVGRTTNYIILDIEDNLVKIRRGELQ